MSYYISCNFPKCYIFNSIPLCLPSVTAPLIEVLVPQHISMICNLFFELVEKLFFTVILLCKLMFSLRGQLYIELKKPQNPTTHIYTSKISIGCWRRICQTIKSAFLFLFHLDKADQREPRQCLEKLMNLETISLRFTNYMSGFVTNIYQLCDIAYIFNLPRAQFQHL